MASKFPPKNTFKLTDDEVEKVLNEYGSYKRKRSIDELATNHASRLRRTAVAIVKEWQMQGVPPKVWMNIQRHTDLVSKLNLKPDAEEQHLLEESFEVK